MSYQAIKTRGAAVHRTELGVPNGKFNTPHARARKHETVAKGKKMSLVFVFLSEQIGRVEFASDVGEGECCVGIAEDAEEG